MRKKIITLILLLISTIGYSQTLTLNVLEHHFKIDETHDLIVSHIDNINDYADLSAYSSVKISLNGADYSFSEVPTKIEYSASYSVNSTSGQYTLYFTKLPIISISSEHEIINDPKVLAQFTYSDAEQIISSNIGIELRGGSSQSFPKKTYDVEFWEDETGDETKKVKFANMRSDDDWILDALYNEPLRIRSYFANKLWLEIHTPYYIEEEEKAKSGADVLYAEVFLNGVYNGLYNLQEQIDKKQLQLKSYNDEIRGELYKATEWGGACTFTSLPEIDNSIPTWGGYELKYPKSDDIIDWTNLYSFTDFVINSQDADFIDNIWSKFNYDNYLDYFIFLNLLRAKDNTGKNIYVAKYKADEPYFYVPWDLEASFGTNWVGENENITNDILTNGFHERVNHLKPNTFVADISARWVTYRQGILKTETMLNSMGTIFNNFTENKVYEREALVYPNYEFNQQAFTYLTNWTNERLNYLDTYFANLVSVEDITASNNDILYPNPAKNFVSLKTDNFKNKKYIIYDFTGRMIEKGIMKNNNLSTENLTEGNYFIIIDNKYHKLIIK